MSGYKFIKELNEERRKQFQKMVNSGYVHSSMGEYLPIDNYGKDKGLQLPVQDLGRIYPRGQNFSNMVARFMDPRLYNNLVKINKENRKIISAKSNPRNTYYHTCNLNEYLKNNMMLLHNLFNGKYNK